MVNEFKTQIGTTPSTQSTFMTLNHDVWNTTADFRIPAQGRNYPNVVPLAQKVVELLKPNGWNSVTLDECLSKAAGSFYRPYTPTDTVCADTKTLASNSQACFV